MKEFVKKHRNLVVLSAAGLLLVILLLAVFLPGKGGSASTNDDPAIAVPVFEDEQTEQTSETPQPEETDIPEESEAADSDAEETAGLTDVPRVETTQTTSLTEEESSSPAQTTPLPAETETAAALPQETTSAAPTVSPAQTSTTPAAASAAPSASAAPAASSAVSTSPQTSAASTSPQSSQSLTVTESPKAAESPKESEAASAQVSIVPAADTVTISISCAALLKNLSLLDAQKQQLVPENGMLLSSVKEELQEGDTVYDVLMRVTRANGILMEYSSAAGSVYIEGIGGLYEFDGGSNSGWMYSVNGDFPDAACSEYELKGGDVICWQYTCDLGSDLK